MVDLVWFLGRVFLAVVSIEFQLTILYWMFVFCKALEMQTNYNVIIYLLALFIFNTKEAAEQFVAQDPYVSNGIVTGHSILEWSVVVGSN